MGPGPFEFCSTDFVTLAPAMLAVSAKSLAALQRQARTRGTEKLTLEEIEAEIAAVRRAKT